MQRSLLTIMLSLILFGNIAFCSDYFVNNISEFNSALTSVLPGDTITLADGEWTDAHVVFAANGTANDSIVMRAQTPGMVVFNGSSTLRIAGEYLIIDGLRFEGGRSYSGAVIEFRNGSSQLSNHCRLTNTAIINYNPPGKQTDYKWISLYGKNNRVDHCYLRGKNHSGTTLVVWLNSQPNYHRIDHNYFGYRPELGFNGGETIRVGTSDWSMYDSYTTVEWNYFEHCNGEVEIISNKSCENIYRYNTFVECEGALTLRHGNRCTVESNYFFGNSKSNTGGVRIIGEDHKVFNNYFQDLKGSSNRSALSIMNGIPNSPLNGYWQVKRAQVIHNTFYNCRYSMTIGRGASSTQSLPPKDCIIANNIVQSSYTLIKQETQPDNLTWLSNIMFGGSLGITQPSGIKIMDPQLQFAADSLFRPDFNSSPAIDSAAGGFAYVLDDMDGQTRSGLFDIGCDEYSTLPVIHTPLRAGQAGPGWFPLPPAPEMVTPVAAGPDSLLQAIQLAQDGDILELISDGGIYENSQRLILDKNLTIRAADSMIQRPILRNTGPNSTRMIFEITAGVKVILKELELDGMAGSATPAKYLIRTDDDPFSENYKLFVDDCYLHDVAIGSDGNFFRAYPGTLADTIQFCHSLFKTAGKEGIRLKDEASGSSLYNVKYFEMSNCTIWDVPKEAINIYAGDEIPYTPGPKIKINHCTFDSCGYDNSHIIYANEADGAVIHNSIFSNSSNSDYSIRIYGYGSEISYCDTANVGPVEVLRGAVIGSGMLGMDPQYTDRVNGNFQLLDSSPLWYQANDGKAMGDLCWAQNPPVSIGNGNHIATISEFELDQNYPNPFNPQTSIRYRIPRSGEVTLEIFTLQGAKVAKIVQRFQNAGEYTVQWHAQNYASGIYLYRLSAPGIMLTKKMMLIK